MEVAHSPGREDNTHMLAKQVPVVIELKLGTIKSAPALGLPDLAKPFTLYVTEEHRRLWECCPRLWGRGTDLRLISRNGWTMLPLDGWDAYGQLLWLPYWSERPPI